MTGGYLERNKNYCFPPSCHQYLVCLVSLHIRGHLCYDGRPDEVSVRIVLHGDAAAVQQDLGTIRLGRTDQPWKLSNIIVAGWKFSLQHN